MRLAGFSLALALLLVACLPGVEDARPQLAVVNAPSEVRLPGAAERLVQLLADTPEAELFGFSSASALRYQERYRDMTGSRAPLQAAFIARSQGAAFAVMVGLEIDKFLFDYAFDGRQLEVDIDLVARVRAQLVDAEAAQVRGRFASPRERVQVRTEEAFTLPEGVLPRSPEGRELLEQQAQAVVKAYEPSAALFEVSLSEVAAAVARTVASILTTP